MRERIVGRLEWPRWRPRWPRLRCDRGRGNATRSGCTARRLGELAALAWTWNRRRHTPGTNTVGSVRPRDFCVHRGDASSEIAMTRSRTKLSVVAMGLFAALSSDAVRDVKAATVTYQLVDNRAQLPPGTKWGTMSAVDIDSKGMRRNGGRTTHTGRRRNEHVKGTASHVGGDARRRCHRRIPSDRRDADQPVSPGGRAASWARHRPSRSGLGENAPGQAAWIAGGNGHGQGR